MPNRRRSRRSGPRGSGRVLSEYTIRFGVSVVNANKFSITLSTLGVKRSGRLLRSLMQVSCLYTPVDSSKQVVAATLAPTVLEVLYFEGSKSNALLKVVQSLVVTKSTLRFRWPKRIDDFSDQEISQEIIRIEAPNVVDPYRIELIGMCKIWVSHPIVPLTSLTVDLRFRPPPPEEQDSLNSSFSRLSLSRRSI